MQWIALASALVGTAVWQKRVRGRVPSWLLAVLALAGIGVALAAAFLIAQLVCVLNGQNPWGC